VTTLAILLAPPVVAGTAWFQLNGNRPDAVALGLAGFAVLMVAVQVHLVPTYLRIPFGPGSWAYSFSYAAAFTVAVHWLAVEDVPHRRTLTYALVAVLTVGIAVLVAALTVRGLLRDTFLPRAPAAPRFAAAGSCRRPEPDPLLTQPRRGLPAPMTQPPPSCD
jgi:tellurite resistance protein